MSRYYLQAYADDELLMKAGKFIGIICQCMKTVCKIIVVIENKLSFKLHIVQVLESSYINVTVVPYCGRKMNTKIQVCTICILR